MTEPLPNDPAFDAWDEHRPDGTKRRVWIWDAAKEKWDGPHSFVRITKGDVFTAEDQKEAPGIYVAMTTPKIDSDDSHGRLQIMGVPIPEKAGEEKGTR